MLIPLIYLISGWRWALFTSDVPLLGKADEREKQRERTVRREEYQKERKKERKREQERRRRKTEEGLPGLVVGWME